MNDFIKNGNKYFVKEQGEETSLEAGKIYTLKYDNNVDSSYLEEMPDFSLPEKIYNTKQEDMFILRVKQYFEKTNELSTGVLLNGLKGSGKTLMMKQIAKAINVPIIIVDSKYMLCNMPKFMGSIRTDVCFLLDELEKNDDYYWRSHYLLTVLDGVDTSTNKKLFIMTSNDINSLNSNLLDRVGRIRYYKEFDGLTNSQIRSVVDDMCTKLDIVPLKDVMYGFIVDHICTKSYDNIIQFINEVSDCVDLYTESTCNEFFESIVEDMNIYTK